MKIGAHQVLGSLLALLLVACGGASTLRVPLTLGQSRDAAELSLEKQKFCRHEGSRKQRQSYVRCHTKGFQAGESWFVVDYNVEQIVARVRRMERYADHEAATERWSALVKERSEELGAESQEARDVLAKLGAAPVGAVVWKVWRRPDSGDIDGIYLVKPEATDDPNVVEVLRRDGTR